MSKKLIRVLFCPLLNVLCLCRKIGFWKFPSGLRTDSGTRLQILPAGVAAQLAKKIKNKKYTNETGSLMKNPFLRFDANYSLTHVDLNTHCTRSLAIDLASCIDLSDRKISCLRSRNLYALKPRVDSFGLVKFILARDCFSTPHDNIIASVG